MDKVKRIGKNLSLRKSIVLYIAIFIFIALVLSIVTVALCDNTVQNIEDRYQPSGEKYYLTTRDGKRLGNGTYIGDSPPHMAEQDERLVAVLGIVPMIATPIYSALCIIAAVLLFYRNKLKKPLAELKAASEKISNSDLDFSIEYESKDELGQLCTSFEIMRSTLADNFSEIWRQVEDRKQLNSAFAHDLRTPLTVLKGYDEMLQASSNSQTRDTAITMGKHIERLEHYVASMSNLRRLEDMHPEYEPVLLQELSTALCDGAGIVCQKYGKRLCMQNKIHSQKLTVDRSFISQVSNNLVTNAVRYAASTVTFCIEEKNGGLLLSISDDGKGFSKNGFHKATNPYFTEDKIKSEHLGLGLYICKMLCNHHGGYLNIKNLASGAKVSAFFKSPSL
jgi:signal transduction histidine kinase